jgi:hypothetical protein
LEPSIDFPDPTLLKSAGNGMISEPEWQREDTLLHFRPNAARQFGS